ncbi:proline-rich early nodulin [Colletotrichum scovillei]|uniref:Proline-rich early nodulin n=1 Tax=Colletotrichum scovillei TaxID=1209932 RepID=A0A9P7UH81_9PEZI|nr:proline-rich early nodulin [Colletotrichum scovillei]KAG7076370.1 proline-rich early nodulin [Colletotrichum scovillei]KAG7083480.1 proline-rich early nodulin [Colletotrichum scovillei]
MGGVASDIEMADACAPSSSSSSSSDLSPPPTYSSDYEGLSQKAEKDSSKEIVKETVGSPSARDDPESEAINTQLPGTDLSHMARRSARNSNKPKPAAASPPKVAKRKQPTKVVPKKWPKWTTQKLLTDPKSPLASANLRAILCQPAAWDILTKEERAEIVSLFPVGTRIIDAGTDEARPDFDALRNNNNFRHDCATYADNISQGRHDPEWLEQAWSARERRRAGDFDDYVTQKFEDEWSCKLPEGFKPNRSSDAPGPAAPAEAGKAHIEQTEETTNQTKGDVIDKVQVEGEAIKQVTDTKAADTTGDANTAEENDAREAPGVALGSPLPEDVSSAKIGTASTEISPEEQVPESSEVPLGSIPPEKSSPNANHQNPSKQTEKQKGKKRVVTEGN